MLAVLLPVLLVPLVIVLPVLLIEFLRGLQQPIVLVALLRIPHDHHLLVSLQVHLWQFPVVQKHVPEIPAVRERGLLLEAYEVFPEVVSLEEDGRVVFEVEVEKRNHLRVAVALQVGKGLLADLEHDVPMVLEQDLGRSVLALLLDLLNDVVHADVDVVQSPLGFQRKSEEGVRLRLGKLVLFDVLRRVAGQKLLAGLGLNEVSGWYFVEMDVLCDGVIGELLEDMGVLPDRIGQHVRPPLEDGVVELLPRLHPHLISILLHYVVVRFGVLPDFVLFLWLQSYAAFLAEERDHEQAAKHSQSDQYAIPSLRAAGTPIRVTRSPRGLRLLFIILASLLAFFLFFQFCDELVPHLFISRCVHDVLDVPEGFIEEPLGDYIFIVKHLGLRLRRAIVVLVLLLQLLVG